MVKPENEKLLKEAADIFLRISENPQDSEALRLRDAFVEKGEAEKIAYDKILRAWKASGTPRKNKSAYTIVAAIIVAFGLYLTMPDIRAFMVADFSTDHIARSIELASGDRVDLDASSALVDDTGSGQRNVELLEGAGYFSVEKNSKPFIVKLDALKVEVLGTEFETSFLEDEISVSVYEGKVSVSIAGIKEELEAGDRLVWHGGDRFTMDAVEPGDVALWRKNRLFADGMTFRQVAEVIGRRLSGNVVVLDEALANLKVTGTFDLTKPAAALEALAAIRGARIIRAQPLTTLIF